MTPARRLLLFLLAGLAALLLVGRLTAVLIAELAWTASLGSIDAGALPVLPALSRAAWLVTTSAWFFLHASYAAETIAAIRHEDRLALAVAAARVSLRTRLFVAAAVALPPAILLTTDAGAWWMPLALALDGAPIGAVDPVLGRDLGFYLATLPWIVDTQRFLLDVMIVTAAVLIFTYAAAGALRVRDRRLLIDRRPRMHLSVILGALALITAWRWWLSSAVGLAGLGSGFPSSVSSTPTLPILATLTAVASVAWIWYPREILPLGAWATLATVWLLFRVAAPFRDAPTTAAIPSPAIANIAFGDSVEIPRPIETGTGNPDSVGTLAALTLGIPSWDAPQLAQRYNANRSPDALHALQSLTLVPGGDRSASRAVWRGPLQPDQERFPERTETDDRFEAQTWGLLEFDAQTGHEVRRDPDARFFYFPDADDYVLVRDGDTEGIDLAATAPRLALTWALQRPELLGAEGRLLWRRAPRERLERLVPVARFLDPYLIDLEGRWTWVLDGYVTARGFPETDPRPFGPGDASVRYARAGFVGTVDAVTGRVAVFLSPTRDPVSDAWARILEPVIQPPDSMPPGLRRSLRYPPTLFSLQIGRVIDRLGQGSDVLAVGGGSATHRVPRWVVARLGSSDRERLWVSAPFTAGIPAHYRAILAGTGQDGHQRLVFQRLRGSAPANPKPPGRTSLTGAERVWPVAGAIFRQQTVYGEVSEGVPDIAEVRAAWGEWSASGRTRNEALSALFYLGPRSQTVPDIWGRWVRAQVLMREADSLFTSGDLSRFAEVLDELKRLLAPGQSPR